MPSDAEGSASVETSVPTYQNTWRQFTEEVYRHESHYKVMRSNPAPPNCQQYRPSTCPVHSSPSSLSAVQTFHLSCSVQSVLIISITDRSCPAQSSPSSLSAVQTVHLSCSVQSVLISSTVRPHYQRYKPFIGPVQSNPPSSAVQTIHMSSSVQPVIIISSLVQSILIISSTDRSSVLLSTVRPHYQQCRPYLSCSVQSVLIISSTDRSSVLLSPVRPHYQHCRQFICPAQSSPSSLSAVQTVHLSCSAQSVLIISSTDRSSVLLSPVRPHYQRYKPFICPVQSNLPSSTVQTIHMSSSVQPVIIISSSVQSILIISSTNYSSVLFSPAPPISSPDNLCPVQSSPPNYQQYRPPPKLSAVQTNSPTLFNSTPS